jgi:hypothetical protein
MNLMHQFQHLGRQQIGLQDAISMLHRIRAELHRDLAHADAWAVVGVMSNVTLIPLNAIINAFELGAAKSLYETAAREFYNKAAKSGTRSEGHLKTVLSSLKSALVEVLKKKGATQFVPGVNILVGLAEDSLATWQAIERREGGLAEGRQLAIRLDRQISTAIQELQRLGMQRAELLSRMDIRSRTA